MNKMYLMKYKVNYTPQTKYKLFSSFEAATNFHRTYEHHILNRKRQIELEQLAFITHYDIIVLDVDLTEQSYIAHQQGNCSVEKCQEESKEVA